MHTAPFNSTQKRSLSAIDQNDNSNLGPGAYIDINNPIFSSMTKNLLKYSVDKNIMIAHGLNNIPFGSGERRFDRGCFIPKEGPGPADYEIDENSEKPNLNDIHIGFSTSSQRFDNNNKYKIKPNRDFLGLCDHKKETTYENPNSISFTAKILPKQKLTP